MSEPLLYIVCARCVHGIIFLRQRRYWTADIDKAQRFKTLGGADKALRHSRRMFKLLLTDFDIVGVNTWRHERD